jgi:hypothetical protein
VAFKQDLLSQGEISKLVRSKIRLYNCVVPGPKISEGMAITPYVFANVNFPIRKRDFVYDICKAGHFSATTAFSPARIAPKAPRERQRALTRRRFG